MYPNKKRRLLVQNKNPASRDLQRRKSFDNWAGEYIIGSPTSFLIPIDDAFKLITSERLAHSCRRCDIFGGPTKNFTQVRRTSSEAPPYTFTWGAKEFMSHPTTPYCTNFTIPQATMNWTCLEIYYISM